MLRLHAGRRAGVSLHQLRQCLPSAAVGGFCWIVSGSNPEPAQKGPRLPDRVWFDTGAVRAGSGSAEQASAEVEPRAAAGAWGGAGDRPAVLLFAVDREGGVAVFVHGRRAGGDGDGGADVRGRGAPLARVAAVQAGVRVAGVAGGGVRETRVGRA